MALHHHDEMTDLLLDRFCELQRTDKAVNSQSMQHILKSLQSVSRHLNITGHRISYSVWFSVILSYQHAKGPRPEAIDIRNFLDVRAEYRAAGEAAQQMAQVELQRALQGLEGLMILINCLMSAFGNPQNLTMPQKRQQDYLKDTHSLMRSDYVQLIRESQKRKHPRFLLQLD